MSIQSMGLTEARFTESVLELIRRTSTDIPEDVERAVQKFMTKEEPKSQAWNTLSVILENIQMARDGSRPLCQDTGTVTFYIHHPVTVFQFDMTKYIKKAVRMATEKHYLRPNVVDPITGKSKDDNIGDGLPVINYSQWDKSELEMYLVLKGGGCENVGAQYSLPFKPIDAQRDVDGVKKCVIHALSEAQGKGCSPGIVGIGIGGDRENSYHLAKHQLLRRLDDENDNPVLKELEEWVLDNGNRLGIGPMGFGGRTTIIGAKAGVEDRLPASYFVSISYMCWAYRRRKMVIQSGRVGYDY